ncbi:DUF4184 family protein [Hymenobacter canadensis]|uniref:DUF4184 family protein n=1 Tax=Hymenobacter canadensis TaxID=2999067 RepID=A0ABY7LRN6_9BACT|nr:DUF4184 family protein [Hymenobacter canadensis]WBA43082.1 DUF4184 family protein [Hymenobacter canadensis]
MPFTLAHTAAVLPLLRRRGLSATGLLVGSIAPDFEKFARMGLHNGHSHTWLSIGYFSLPVGVALAFTFHLLVRDALLAHLPAPLYQRLAAVRRLRWRPYFRRHYGAVLLSIGLGAATHLLWDGLTHRRPLLVRYLPQLLGPVPGLPGAVPVYKVLELLSSGLGTALVLALILRLPRLPLPLPLTRGARRRYWGLAAGTATGLWAARVLPALPALAPWDAVVSALSAGLLGLVAASVYYPGSLARSR